MVFFKELLQFPKTMGNPLEIGVDALEFLG
jgi:hypothetical protein